MFKLGVEMNITLIFLLSISVLAVWNITLTVLLLTLKKKNSAFFETDKGNIYELLQSAISQNRKVLDQNAKINKDLEKIGDIIKNSFQKSAMIRYNPFKDTGGNQSFSLAVLDLNNNGFIITSIHGREVNRVYSKPVEKGRSTHNLSAEEESALAQAVNKK